jgi:tetratricopeptide (TPR) repeat protein
MENELLNNGLSEFIEDNYHTALSYFSEALEKNEHCERALLYKGCTHNKLGEYELAISDFSKITNPNFDVLYNRAIAYFNSEKLEDAKKDLNKLKESTLTEDEERRLNTLLNKLNN